MKLLTAILITAACGILVRCVAWTAIWAGNHF
jgi:hypothetical protein